MNKIITGTGCEFTYPYPKIISNDPNFSNYFNFIYGKKTFRTYAYYGQEDYFNELKEKIKTLDDTIFECDSNIDAWEVLEGLKDKGVKEVEVMGAWANACVAATVIRALEYDMEVYVPEDKIFYSINPKKYKQYIKQGVDMFNNSGIKGEPIGFKYSFNNGIHVFERQYEFKLLKKPYFLEGPPSNMINKIKNYTSKVFDKFL